MRGFFLASWATAVLVATVPVVYFLVLGWPAREAEFVDKVGATTKMDFYFDRFWAGQRTTLRKHGLGPQALFRKRYRSLIGWHLYIAPGLVFVAVLTLLSGLVAATTVRSGYNRYVEHLTNEAMDERRAGEAGVTIGRPTQAIHIPAPTLDRSVWPLPRVDLSLAALSAIAGAYVFVVASLIQKCRARTLVYSDLFAGSLRLLIAAPLGLSFSGLATPSLAAFASFALGAFPISRLATIAQQVAGKRLGFEVPQATEDQTLSMVGVTQPISDVLAQENITCAQQLADVDPVVLALRTGLSFDYVLFLAAQSLVRCFVGRTAAALGPLGMADARAIWFLMRKSAADQDQVFRSLAARMPGSAAAPAIDEILLRQAFRKIARDPYTIFLVDFTSVLSEEPPQARHEPEPRRWTPTALLRPASGR